MSDEQPRRKDIGYYVDIVQKVLIGIGAVLVGAYFAVIKESFDESAKCAEAQQSILQFVYGKAFDHQMSLRPLNRWISRECSDDESSVVRWVHQFNRWISGGDSSDDKSQNLRDRWVDDLIVTSNWTPSSRQVEEPQAPPVIPGPPEAPQWVAVGFADSSDSNFVDKNGKNITRVPSVGTVRSGNFPTRIDPRLVVRDQDDEHSHGQHGSDPDKSRIGGLIHKNIYHITQRSTLT
jgi:hypothetical protein